MIKRPRRNRKNQSIRDLVSNVKLDTSDLVMPLFIKEGGASREEVKMMPGIYRENLEQTYRTCEKLLDLNIKGIALFPCIDQKLKDKMATESFNENGLVARGIREIKKRFPELCIITDVAMDPYNSDGHDGLVSDQGEIMNDETLEILSKMAVLQATCGSDIVAPSDMMDGRVAHIRQSLDKAGFTSTSVMSYSVKYCSSFYGPFRSALESAPKDGDKKSYQMDYRASREAMREVRLDIEEGADIVLIKPGMPYLDIVHRVSSEIDIPLAVYQVSGEYAMIVMASREGAVNREEVILESLISFKRAGADFILTYFAMESAALFKKKY